MVGAEHDGRVLEEGQHNGEKTLKELDQEFQRGKKKLSLVDDIKVFLAILLILLLASTVVSVKTVMMEGEGGNISTFKPLTQQKISNMRRVGVGFIPCNG